MHGFSRYHKYSLGTDLRDAGRRTLKLVVRANARHDKAPLLLELREELEEVKALLRLGRDIKAFSRFGSFEHAIGLVVEIGKQNEGWLKSQPSIGAGQNRSLLGQADGQSNSTTIRAAE